VFTGIWLYSSARTPFGIAIAVLGGIAFGWVFAVVFRRMFAKEILKPQKEMVAEQFRGQPTISSELELRREAVWIRQAGIEMIFPWSLCTSIIENADDIEMNFLPGVSVIRNRYFATPAERTLFLETARTLAGKEVKPKPDTPSEGSG